MPTLSVFVDESGDFGDFQPRSPYYILSLVFHDQSKDISGGIHHLTKQVRELGFDEKHAIHTAPLIRREKEYVYLKLPERRKLFRRLYDFSRLCDITYKSFIFLKKECPTRDELAERITKELTVFVRENFDFFRAFDEIIVYYDNGQKEIRAIIGAVFRVLLDAEIRRVKPSDYYLFQTADLFCTLELVQRKLKDNGLSTSEETFFRNRQTLKKNYLKPIMRKRLS